MTHATALLWMGVVLIAGGELVRYEPAGRLVKLAGVILIFAIAARELVS